MSKEMVERVISQYGLTYRQLSEIAKVRDKWDGISRHPVCIFCKTHISDSKLNRIIFSYRYMDCEEAGIICSLKAAIRYINTYKIYEKGADFSIK
jgi:hypothetical protein